MILLIDNYDSFSYNLYQMIGAIDPRIRVIRNDALSVEEIDALAPGGIVLSPGPGRPEDAGVCIDVVKETLPSCLKVTARTEDGEIMALRHLEYEVYGIQFHPESILTPHGNRILENFVNITGS